ncbi:MAG: Hsp20/alpha crystallin family protein [Desulfobacterales bacterium]|nr:MAG: Hsp20/alpha crystallin family protein [Desulfobacterales bacterium]
MTELTLWKKQEIEKLRRDMDLLFRRFRRGFGVPRALLEAAESFAVDLSETENSLILRVEVPGLKPEDIQVTVTEDTLTLKGETRERRVEKGETYQRVEKRSQSFSRTLTLPCRVLTDEVKATYKDDILQIVLPKCKPQEARGITIEVR